MKFSLQQLTAKATVLPLLLLQNLPQANGHFDGVVSKRWEYVRPTTNFGPNYDYSGPDSMCGFDATKPRFPVKTIKVEAGSTIGFGASGQTGDYGSEWNTTLPFDPNWEGLYHDGPATAYLSKAPGELNDYEGDGYWFKVAVVGAKDGMNWDYSQKNHVNQMNFTIPQTTPPGKYLMRAEHLNILTTANTTQMYANCAHIEITGSGGGNPSPTTKFPGAFNWKDNGIWLPNAFYEPYQPLDPLKNWQGAGPKIWKG